MANTETENLFNAILDDVKKGTATIETIESTKGTDARGKEAILTGKWKIGDYIFSYTIPEGKKYGKAAVEQEGSDAAVDTFGIDKTIMCIVYFLRNPKPAKKEKVKKEKAPKTEKKVAKKEKTEKTPKTETVEKAPKAEKKAKAPKKSKAPVDLETEVQAEAC